MQAFKRILVGIDFSEIDKTLIEYTRFVCDTFRPEVVYFVHAEKNLALPEELAKELGVNSTLPSDETLLKKLEDEVSPHFKDVGFEVECQIVEGEPFKEMLHWSHIKKTDLLIVGRKVNLKGSGVLPQKLARKISCSVLFVPEDTEPKLQRVLLPIDESPSSELALQTINSVFANNEGIEFVGQHCYSVPLGYYKTGKSFEEFANLMEKHSRNDANQFMSELSDLAISINHKHVLADDGDVAESIGKAALEDKVDLIVMGARGKTDAAAILLGSVTEKLLVFDEKIPVLVIKKKGETIGFLQALFNLD